MAEGIIATWVEQTCLYCESHEFTPVVRILAKPGGGVTTSPVGFQCAQCGKKADVSTMQRDALRKQRLKELRALEAEIDEAVPVVQAGVTKS